MLTTVILLIKIVLVPIIKTQRPCKLHFSNSIQIVHQTAENLKLLTLQTTWGSKNYKILLSS